MHESTRRRYLALAGTAGALGLAGCSGVVPTDSADGGGGEQGAGDGTGTARRTPLTDTPLANREPGWIDRLGSAANLSYNPVPGPGDQPSEAWSVDVPEQGFLVAEDGRVVVTEGSTDRLAAYGSSTGERQWRTGVGEESQALGLLLTDDHVLLRTRPDETPPVSVTVALDPATGEEAWRIEEPVQPFVQDGSLYTIAAAEGGGRILQRRDAEGAVVGSAPLPDVGRVFAAGAAGTLLFRTGNGAETAELAAVDLADAEVRWRVTPPESFTPATVPTVPRSGVATTGRTAFVFVTPGDGVTATRTNLVAYDLADGSERWRLFGDLRTPTPTPTDGFRGPSGIRGAPGYCYLQYRNGRLVARDERTGALLTTVRAGGGDEGTGFAVAAVGREAAYLLRTQRTDDGVQRSLVARDHTLSRTVWTREVAPAVTRLVPTGERVLGVAGGDAPRLVAFE